MISGKMSLRSKNNISNISTNCVTCISSFEMVWSCVKYFEKNLGSEQNYPSTAEAQLQNRLFAQFHAPQTKAMKDQILTELASPISKARVIFATVVMGMGVNIPEIRHIIHVGPPRSIREYFQETGRAGRDGKPATATLYYNNVDIAKNKPGMSDDVWKVNACGNFLPSPNSGQPEK